MAIKRPFKSLGIINQKGGAGKTTATLHLAQKAEATGYGPVAMIDLDPQQSLARQYHKREAETPKLAKADAGDLQAVLERLKGSGYKLVFVDTPPSLTDAFRRAIRATDFLLVPMQASPLDLEAVGPAIDLVKLEKKPFMFFMNRIKANTTLCREAIAVLSRHGHVAKNIVGDRTDFQGALVDGRTIQELSPKSLGAAEISALWQEIAETVYPTKPKEKAYA